MMGADERSVQAGVLVSFLEEATEEQPGTPVSEIPTFSKRNFTDER